MQHEPDAEIGRFEHLASVSSGFDLAFDGRRIITWMPGPEDRPCVLLSLQQPRHASHCIVEDPQGPSLQDQERLEPTRRAALLKAGMEPGEQPTCREDLVASSMNSSLGCFFPDSTLLT